ncbi:hypothetical protein VOLCADRAFT_76928 [Volvox carteri f. nagariensis]|uniref:C2 domain-containing protein n=1 Tax=Volvox carteri f. nagariensis TaxID=3068 RepID=D8UBC8_VOLCA|nr:uncharacterized protein VOLCADRAFT_76928 [Volvox carteri f. nagariensis]EFJ42927.1 hypothetical protein VOLCADRAFT_76928 [Volvox carteri f. nagariensis]|eukprot:XP_002955967.1 hypothetical protein VOLCADRAFT_76928 [Volvox carteri f. nagariensis]
MGVLFHHRDGSWVEFGRTEMIANTYDPTFIRRFRLMFNFEVVQRFRIIIVDIDKGQDPSTVHPESCNFLGFCDFELAQVFTGAGKKLTLELRDDQGKTFPKSTITLTAEEETSCKDVFRFQIEASNLRPADALGKPDPFLQISRLQDGGTSWLPVFKSEAIRKCTCPVWRGAEMRAGQLHNGDMHRTLRFQVYDYERNGVHKLLGYCDLSASQLLELGSQGGAAIPLKPPPGKRRPGNFGTLRVKYVVRELRPSFLDYIVGGAEVGFVVAVDLTASNGDPRLPTSKHYISCAPTEYEHAIMGVGQVLMHYDNDKMFPMLGFGGRKCSEKAASHCFTLGDGPDGSCTGISGLLAQYRRALVNYALSGPTYFAPVIREATRLAADSLRAGGPIKYTCLMILTDGEVMDVDATIEAIIDASALPLSILMVGIGCEEFGKLKMLDSDKRLLTNGRRTAVRDIVQFVEFNRFACDGPRLARELLAELPGQMVDYWVRNKILPPQMVLPGPVGGEKNLPADRSASVVDADECMVTLAAGAASA